MSGMYIDKCIQTIISMVYGMPHVTLKGTFEILVQKLMF